MGRRTLDLYRDHGNGWWFPYLRFALGEVDDLVLEGCCPSPERIFRAFDVRPDEVQVVILGQDPYPTPGKATGLAFGVDPTWAESTKYKPHSSILNIQEEVLRSTGQRLEDLSLQSWAGQGALLLNTRLTVAPGCPLSHAGHGWEGVVADALRAVQRRTPDAVVFAWGGEARRIARQHAPDLRIMEASHPCKYSAARGRRPFVGCGHFSAVPHIQWGNE